VVEFLRPRGAKFNGLELTSFLHRAIDVYSRELIHHPFIGTGYHPAVSNAQR
jgi:hypothetical protein